MSRYDGLPTRRSGHGRSRCARDRVARVGRRRRRQASSPTAPIQSANEQVSIDPFFAPIFEKRPCAVCSAALAKPEHPLRGSRAHRAIKRTEEITDAPLVGGATFGILRRCVRRRGSVADGRYGVDQPAFRRGCEVLGRIRIRLSAGPLAAPGGRRAPRRPSAGKPGSLATRHGACSPKRTGR